MSRRTAIIIGAGPAGLTAAYEFAHRTAITPIVVEASDSVGGLSRTVLHNGNRLDIGGHRFFSKSDQVMDWWLRILPMQALPPENARDPWLSRRKQWRGLDLTAGPNPQEEDDVMLLRRRRSRILHRRRFFDYPLRLNRETLANLGAARILKIGVSYMGASLFPVKPELSLADFYINRFGEELYRTFFRDYTEKVSGLKCTEIAALWGLQRVKGLSVGSAVRHALQRIVDGRVSAARQETELSLLARFLYPKLGPGQLWERVAELIEGKGGQILRSRRVIGVQAKDGRVLGVTTVGPAGRQTSMTADYVLSSMPVRDLIRGMDGEAPPPVRSASEGLRYRDYLIVGLLLNRLRVSTSPGAAQDGNGHLLDNWIYIQEPDMLMGRLQLFNNWSPFLVRDPRLTWIGAEYFCNEGDAMWRTSDRELAELAIHELTRIGFADREDVLDSVVVRAEKSYPLYSGTYDRFDEVRRFLDRYDNLIPIGRNGMHRYNNQDHSMLSAMAAVDNIAQGRTDKSNVWVVGTENSHNESW